MEVKQKNDDDKAMAERLFLLETHKEVLKTHFRNLAIRTVPIGDFLARIESFQRRHDAMEETIATIFAREGIVCSGVGLGDSSESSCGSSGEGASEATGEPILSVVAFSGGESDSDKSVGRSAEDLRCSRIGDEEK